MPANDRNYDPFASGGTVNLDFPALKLWWKNGNAKLIPATVTDAKKRDTYKSDLGVAYFGGWCAHQAKADQALDEMSLEIIPGFSLLTMSGSEGQYNVYASRNITIAPILKRVGWFTNERAQREYSCHQILALAASIDKATKKFVLWGPVLLSATSTSGLAVTDALSTWKRSIAKHMNPNTEASEYWVTIGTIRGDIYSELRGKGQNKSPITPCEAYLPLGANNQPDLAKLPDFVKNRWIGEELKTQLIEYREISMDWAAHWNERTAKNQTSALPPEPDGPPEDTSDLGAGIPF